MEEPTFQAILVLSLASSRAGVALLEVVAFHHPGSPAEVEQEAASLLQALA